MMLTACQQSQANVRSSGHLGKARLYKDMQTLSCCFTGASNQHFMDPCVPTGSCAAAATSEDIHSF